MSTQSQLSRPELQIVVESFRPYSKNTPQGFLSLSLPAVGIKIKDVCLHEKNGSKWVSMPARPYDQDGTTKWVQILEYDSKESREAFQRAAIRAIEAYQFTEAANPQTHKDVNAK